MRKGIFGVLVLLSSILVGFSQTLREDATKNTLSRGTLIVIVPTKDGLVVCADRRLHNDITGDTDTGLKIRPFESGVFAASGHVSWPSGALGTIDLFSATEFALAQKNDAPAVWAPLQNLPSVRLGPFNLDATELPLGRAIGSGANAMLPGVLTPSLNQNLVWPNQVQGDLRLDSNDLNNWRLPTSVSPIVVGIKGSLGEIDSSSYLKSVSPFGDLGRTDSAHGWSQGINRPSSLIDLTHSDVVPIYPLALPNLPSSPLSRYDGLSVLTQDTAQVIGITGYDPAAVSRTLFKPEQIGVSPDALKIASQLSDAISLRIGVTDESPLKGLDKIYVQPIMPPTFSAIGLLVQPGRTLSDLTSNKLSLPEEWQTGLSQQIPVNRFDPLMETIKPYSFGIAPVLPREFLNQLQIVPNPFAIPPLDTSLDGSKKKLFQDWLKNSDPSNPPLTLDLTHPGLLPRNDVRIPESKPAPSGKSGASTGTRPVSTSNDSSLGDDSFNDTMKRVAEYLGSQLQWVTRSNVNSPGFGKMPDNQFFEVRFFYATAAGQLKEQALICRLNTDVLGNVRSWEISGGTPTDDLSVSKPILSGSPELYFALLDSKDHRYDDLRSNPFIKPFLSSPRPSDQVTANEALAFSHALIEATSKRGQEINKDIHVSESCNCGLLDRQGRFKWISADDYPPPRFKSSKK